MTDIVAGCKIVVVQDIPKPPCGVVPVKGTVYTCRDILPLECGESIGPLTILSVQLVLRVNEVRNGPCACLGGDEIAFNVGYFRRVQEKSTETGMEILNKIRTGETVVPPETYRVKVPKEFENVE